MADSKTDSDQWVEDLENDFDQWVEGLENEEQPNCNIQNPDECDSCGS